MVVKSQGVWSLSSRLGKQWCDPAQCQDPRNCEHSSDVKYLILFCATVHHANSYDFAFGHLRDDFYLDTTLNAKGCKTVMTDFKYRLVKRGEVTFVEVNPHPDWQEFKPFVEQFVAEQGVQLVELDTGMDRHQFRYRHNAHQYVMQFEHYTDSIWIEKDY